MASQSSYLKNSYEEYSPSKVPSILNEGRNGLSSSFQETLQAFTKNKLVFMNTEMENDIFYDTTVYTGSAGFGLFYFMCAITDENDELLKQSLSYINIKKQLKGKRISFLCGDAGPLALATVISYKLGNRVTKKPYRLPEYTVIAERLLALISLLSESPDEVLYGKAGYLYALLFVKKYIPDDTVIPPDHIKKVVRAIIKSGRHYSTQVGSESPLLWQWHDKVYLGAAHGVAGILYMLLQAHDYVDPLDMSDYVEPTLQWLLRQRLGSGNYPSSLGSPRDRLVQWCHGAPGFVPLCVLAHQYFKNDKYLKIAKECGEVVWRRGLCAKGFSLCHGVAGNAYTFIQLYQATKDPVHLYRAGCFMEWCVSARPGSQARAPDRRASLFEGLPGRLYLAEELNHVDTAKFPAFEL